MTPDLITTGAFQCDLSEISQPQATWIVATQVRSHCKLQQINASTVKHK